MSNNSKAEEHIFSQLPRAQFHSCLLTTFSFDFNYFYHEVRSQLNRAEIINTNVLVDDSMLQHYLGTMTGYAHDSVKKFAITGIPSKRGVFHPKLGLFFGDKEKGFLIIGSGNLTACGHGKNQELWGTFHIDGPDDPKAPLFKKAWNYLHNFKNQMSGISSHKIDWIEQHSGWISKIPDIDDGQWIPLDDTVEAQLLINFEGSIWRRFSSLLKMELIEDVTVISPFFDGRGDTLVNLCNLAGTADVHLIVQVQSCAFPKMDTFEIPKNLIFHNWDSIQTEELDRYVHAKLVYVKTANMNYCLIGSANLTSAGMGTDEKDAQNEEASILLRTKKDIMKEILGLENRGDVIPASEIVTEGKAIEGRFSKTSMPLRISSIDRYSISLHVYMPQIVDISGLDLRLFNGWDEQIGTITINTAEYSIRYACYKAGFAGDGEIFFAQLFNADTGKPVSNKVVVHDAKALLNTNPDPANKKLEKAIALIESGQTDLLSLLQYIDPEVLVETKKKPVGGGGAGEQTEPKQQDGSGEVLGYDHFTQQAEKDDKKGLELLSHEGYTIDRILELVRLLLQKAAEQVADNKNEDEETEKENVDSTEGREDKKVEAHDLVLPPQKQSAFINNQRKLSKFFDKYIKTLAMLLKKKVPPTKLDHSLFAVVMHLVIDFYKKPFLVEDNENEKIHRRYLLDTSQDFFDKTDYCRYIAEIIGQYCMLLTFSQDNELTPYEKSVLDNVKRSAYWNAICAISIATIGKVLDKDAETWIWELFMNLRHQCGVDNCADKVNATKHLSALVNIVATDDRDKFFAQMIAFWERYESMFQKLELTGGFEKGLTEVGLRVYSDIFGFCHISSREVSGDRNKIELSRPGYLPNAEHKDFLLGKKFIAEMLNLKPICTELAI